MHRGPDRPPSGDRRAEGAGVRRAGRPADRGDPLARHFALGETAFENACYARAQPVYPGPELHSLPSVSVDAAGRVFLGAYVSPTPRELLGSSEDVGLGSVVLAFDADGRVLWLHRVPAGDQLAGVAGVLPTDDGGADALMRIYSSDGLDTHTLVHLDAGGRASARASMTVTPMRARRRACHLGPEGCSIAVEWLRRASDGSVWMYGTMAGVELHVGAARARSRSTGRWSSGFWARFEPDGRLRWLRGTPHVMTAIVPAHDTSVVALFHSRSHQEHTRIMDTRTGAVGPASVAAFEASWPISRAIALYSIQRRLLATATCTYHDGVRRPLVGAPIGTRIDTEQVEALSRLDSGAPRTELVQLPDGSFARFMTLHGRLQLGAHAVESTHRMVPCYPGNVGEEFTLPPDCREPLERPSAVLIHWPSAP